MTLWINGDWVTGEGDARTKTNPVGQEVLWSGNDASAGQVEQACQAARRAFPAWAKRPFSERQALVEKFAALLEANKAELTRIIACETSKPRWEATTEVTAMINNNCGRFIIIYIGCFYFHKHFMKLILVGKKSTMIRLVDL